MPATPGAFQTQPGGGAGDKASVVQGKPILTTKAKSSSPPGTYPIVVKQGSLSAMNYKFKEVDGSITIVK